MVLSLQRRLSDLAVKEFRVEASVLDIRRRFLEFGCRVAAYSIPKGLP